MSVKNLFRKEVLDSRVERFNGPIRLAQPISRSIVVGITILVLVGLFAFGFYGTVNRKARVTGLTVPSTGSVTVSSPFAGVVSKIRAVEGAYVNSGDVLFEIKTERLSDGGDINLLVSEQLARRKTSYMTESSLAQDRYKAEDRNIETKLKNLITEMQKLDEELKISELREENIRKNVEKFASLQKSGFLSPSQQQQKENELLDATSRTQSLSRSKIQLQAQQAELDMMRKQLKPKEAAELEKINGALTVVEQQLYENELRKGGYVSAQQSGIISTISAQEGQAVTSNRVLATLIPGPKLKTGALPELDVLLYVSSRNVGFVEEGNEVLLRYHAFPYQIFGLQRGRVTDVSRTPLTMAEIPENLVGTIQSSFQGSSGGQEALFRVRVTLNAQDIKAYGRAHKIRPGMSVDADIVQERQRIWQLFFGPALALVGR